MRKVFCTPRQQQRINVLKENNIYKKSCIIQLMILGFSLLLLSFPAYAKDQYLLVSNRESGDILRYNAETGAFVDVFLPDGTDGIKTTSGMTLGPDGNLYVVAWSSSMDDPDHVVNPRVVKIDSHTGKYLGTFASDSSMSTPFNLAFGPDKNLYVSNIYNQVFRFDGTTGTSMGLFATGSPEEGFRGLTWGPDGNLYATTVWEGHLDRFDGATGASLSIFPTPETSTMTFAKFGPDGLLYASEYFGHDVDAYNINTGELVKSFHGLYGANGMAFGDDGDLFVASYFSNQIFKFENGSGMPGTLLADGPPLHGPMDLLLMPVPEPSIYAMLLAGLGLLGFTAYRRK